jgi:hypothetical protein
LLWNLCKCKQVGKAAVAGKLTGLQPGIIIIAGLTACPYADAVNLHE